MPFHIKYILLLLFPASSGFSVLNLGDAHPQLLFRPALRPVPSTTLELPQSHMHNHMADPDLLFSFLSTTNSFPNLSLVNSMTRPFLFISAPFASK